MLKHILGFRNNSNRLIILTKLWFFGFLVFLFFCGYGEARIKITSADQIRFIAVKGNNQIRQKDILREIKSTVGDNYLQSAVEEDFRRIYALGYFADVKLDVVKEPTGVTITFVVKENPVVVDIIFEGNKAYRAKRLKDEIGFKKTIVLQSDTLDKYTEKIKSFYESKEFSVEVKGTIEPLKEDSCQLRFMITEKKRQKIVKLDIQGNKNIKTKQLLKKIKSKKTWWIIRHYYNPDDIIDDCASIERTYKEEGFLKTKVIALEPEPVPGKDGMVLRFVIEEGAQYRWNKIAIAGNTLFSTGELQTYLHSSTGKTYRQSMMEGDMIRLYERYANQGYIQTEVKPQIVSNDTEHTVAAIYFIHENPRSYLGNINVQGIMFNESRTIEEVPLKTKKKVVLREVSLHPGDVLSRREVLKTQQKLYNLGYFDQVAIIPEATLSEDTMDLTISVVEKKTGNITFGGGYSSEKKAELFLDLSDPNLFGTGRQVRIHTAIAEEGTDYSLTLREPYLFDTPLTAEISIFRESLDRSLSSTPYDYDSTGNIVYSESSTHDYQERQTGESIFVSYPVNDKFRWTARLKNVKVTLEPEEEGYIIPSIVGPAESITHSVTPGLIYDSRDNYFWPSQGSRYVANVEVAGGPFGGDNNYIKYYGESSWYKQFGERLVGAVRLRAGYIQPYDDTEDAPLPDRFFLGGANSLRGYDFRGVAPHITYIDEQQQEVLEVNVGGDVMLNANFELRRPLVERVYGILFLDAGGVWQKMDDVDLSEIRYGIGSGILLNLPIGYIQLGYGYPINDQPGDETQGFYFTFGTTF